MCRGVVRAISMYMYFMMYILHGYLSITTSNHPYLHTHFFHSPIYCHVIFPFNCVQSVLLCKLVWFFVVIGALALIPLSQGTSKRPRRLAVTRWKDISWGARMKVYALYSFYDVFWTCRRLPMKVTELISNRLLRPPNSLMTYSKIERALVRTKQILNYYRSDVSLEMEYVGWKHTFTHKWLGTGYIYAAFIRTSTRWR